MAWQPKANIRGPRGYTGRNGTNGVSVQRANINSGDLIVGLDDGSQINAGTVRGPQGLPGANALPTDDAVAGYVSTQGASATKAALLAGFASQLTVTSSTTTATINDWLSQTSALGVKRLVGSCVLTAALVIPSGTTLDASGASITSTFVGNMLQNTYSASTTQRDSNITIIGGKWQRNAGGPPATATDGSANGAHSLFLRHVDNLTIRGLTVGSTGGKYMIALGDVTNFRVSDISGKNLSSDTVHITGPASNGLVERVTVGTGGDDVVAITTTDYAAYSDVHGDVTDVTIRQVKGGNTTRAVLVAGNAYGTTPGDGHLLDRIIVDTVTQTSTGAAVWTAAVGNTDVFGSIEIAHVYGGPVQLRHPNHRNVVVRDAPRGVIVTTQDANTVANIARLFVRDTTVSSGNLLLLNNTGITIDHLELQNVSSTASSLVVLGNGVVKRLLLRSSYFAAMDNVITASGTSTLGALLVDAVTATLNAVGSAFLRLNGSAVLGSATFSDCTVTAVDTATGILVNATSTTSGVSAVTVNRGTFTGIARFLDKVSGLGGTTSLRLTDCTIAGANRLVQVGGGTLDFAYSNIRLSGLVNQPLRIYNGAAATISGAGWFGYTDNAVSRAGSESVRSFAGDFPVDVSLLLPRNGDQATNTNTALSCGYGRVLANGSNWKNLYSGATY